MEGFAALPVIVNAVCAYDLSESLCDKLMDPYVKLQLCPVKRLTKLRDNYRILSAWQHNKFFESEGITI
jgi:hypothetical protein